MPQAQPPQPYVRPVLSAVQKILAADGVALCHAALAEAVVSISASAGCSVRACEISVALSGEISVVWQAGDPDAIPFDEKGHFSAWFARALQRSGELSPFYGNVAGLVVVADTHGIPLHVGLVADGMPESIEGLTEAMKDIAGVAAQQLNRLRRDAESRMSRARLDRVGGLQAELLRANVDLLWEADQDGAMHVVQVFNERRDLVRLIEGRYMQDLRVAGGRSLKDVVISGRTSRSLRLEQAGGEILYISMSAARDASRGLKGTLSVGPDLTADRLAADVSILETLLNARTREEQARQEAESMLLGLRVLLAPAPFREKLEALARHLARSVDCDMVQIIQLRPGETPRLLSPSGLVSSQGAEALRRVLATGEGRSVTVLPAASEDCAVIRDTLGMHEGDIALVTLPYAAERYYLICRGRPSFGLGQRGLAERLSLLLQQALALHDDQEKMVHTAKLSALGQMSTSIAHELRQPLNTISIAAQNVSLLLERDAITPQLLQEKTDRILQQVERACRVMDRMRRFGRKSNSDYKPVPLKEVVCSARSLMHAMVEQAGITIEMGIADDIEVLADELELEQVLVNLLQNARDAIMEGGATLPRRIQIRACVDSADCEQVRLDVQDSGPGFAPHILGHALDAFFTTKAGDKGTGLGLSISHAILREHGGRLQIGNAEDGGGLITLFLRRGDDRNAKVVPIGLRRRPEET